MLGLSSICLIIAVFTAISTIMTKRRKTILLCMEICACIWLEADRVAYIYHGYTGEGGRIIVILSNFFVFLMTVAVLTCVTFYLDDVMKTEGRMINTHPAIQLAMVLGAFAAALVVLSQFTGLYYTVDASNVYHRSKLYFISYIFPYLILLIQLSILLAYRKKIRGRIAMSIFCFVAVCLLASMIQFFAYGVSLVDMSAVLMVVGLYIFALIEMNDRVVQANRATIENLIDEHKSMRKLFEQTVTALVSAIDAKDPYTQGHSMRVAEYAREIARLSGMDEKKCDEVYFSAILHDVGKIGISDDIIKKNDNLTAKEYEIVKKHPSIGGEILSGIKEFPFISIGARYHHERYDGKGYPEGLSGESIPDVARIVAVADTYDSMTSKRYYRDPMPQSTVREEIVKAAGTQLDPDYSLIMVDMIDHDTEYLMREKENFDLKNDDDDLMKVSEMHFGEYKEHVSEGVRITDSITKITFESQPEMGFDEKKSLPSIILFDSHDGCVHKDDRGIRLLHYLEYGEIWPDGNVISTSARDMKTEISNIGEQNEDSAKKGVVRYEIEAVRYRDHVKIRFASERLAVDVTCALPDSIRFSYLALTGEHCHIMNISVDDTGEKIDENYIERLADEVSFIDKIKGDIPNVQVEGYRSGYTEAVPVRDGMRLRFRTMSLPTANLIWHCAFILLFTADDGIPLGENYTEHGCIRLDGENATNNDLASNTLSVYKDENFHGWDGWKKDNKLGFECEVLFTRRRDHITMETYNCGIHVKSTTVVAPGCDNVYMSLTGDQCALTDIRVLDAR